MYAHSWYDGDEELAAIGIRPSVSHTNCVRSVMAERWVKFVSKLTTPDAFAASSGTFQYKAFCSVVPVWLVEIDDLPRGSPVWIMKPLMTRWKTWPL